MKIAVLISIGLGLAFAGAAEAKTFWSTPAAACVPVVDAGKTALHKTGLATVQFSGVGTGLITLDCPVPAFDSAGFNPRIKLTYQDSTGSGTTASVVARLYSMPIGTITPVNVASLSSDSSPVTSANDLTGAFIGAPLDFETNMYWARITLKRSASTETVVLHALTIEGLAF